MRIILALLLIASDAFAVAPCPTSCHLGQGTPVIVDKTILITLCDATNGKETCATKRLDQEGKVIEKLPRPRTMGSDSEFTEKYLTGTVKELRIQGNWTAGPYSVGGLALSLDTSKVTCQVAQKADVVRDFGCTPTTMRVYAVDQRVVVIGVCQPTKISTHEAAIVCSAG